jgi:hypothetical protein
LLYPWRSTWVRLTAAAVGVVAAAIVVVTGIAAPAPAHIALNASRAATGSTVTGSGSGFIPDGSVRLTLDRTSGSTLWSGAPDRSGSVAFSFTVPAAAAGSHTVVATETGHDGQPVSGTTATAPLRITAASPPSAAATQSAQPGTEGSAQKQPGSQPHGQPRVPGVASVTAPSGPASLSTIAPPGADASPAPAPPVVFTLPDPGAKRLTNPPPQVATMWRVEGAVPNSATAQARVTPEALQLVALAVLVASAIVLIATTLRLRNAEPAAPGLVRDAPQHHRARHRSATMRSPDLWSGSPARLR